jgi:MoaA/NifB/PqqE/SkfB family radical SAM enzyme
VFTPDKIAILDKQLEGWGVQSACVGGGGEPTLSPHLTELYEMCDRHHLALSLTTSGQRPVPDTVVRLSHWIGFSVDAATDATYRGFKGAPISRVFEMITDAITKKRSNGWPTEITYKFLIFPGNEHEVLAAYENAIRLGCDSFHIRPVSINATRSSQALPPPDLTQFRELKADPRCKLRVIDHRFVFGPNTVTKCTGWTAATITADGKVGVCPDQKGEAFTQFTTLEHLREEWCGPAHRALMASIDPAGCPHCPYTADALEIDTLTKEHVWI